MCIHVADAVAWSARAVPTLEGSEAASAQLVDEKAARDGKDRQGKAVTFHLFE